MNIDSMLMPGVPALPDKERSRETEGTGRRDGVAVISISRHRIATDGKGVTTLVAFHGCPLRCKYCLNKECWEPEERFEHYTPQSLYDVVKVDDIYFRATSGGITFGGGEPCLQADFIVEFRRICGPDWKIRVETSLNVDRSLIDKLAPVVDEWIVDTKAERSATYKEYTGADRRPMIENLDYLTSEEKLDIPKSRIYLRVPVIPGYVDEQQAEETRRMFAEISRFPNVELFRYVTDEKRGDVPEEGRGKRVCELLKAVRREIAIDNGLRPVDRECTNQGECSGTCPACEMETALLEQQLEGKEIAISDTTLSRIAEFDSKKGSENERSDNEHILGNIPLIEDFEPWKPEFECKEIVFKECAVAGVSFHLEKDDELWDELEVGTELALVRDRNNKHDSNAVAVALDDDYEGDPDDFDFDFILGYIPRGENAELAAMMDAGYADKFSAKITTFKKYGNYNDRIRLTIFLRSNEPEVVRPTNLIRAQSVSFHELREMIEELDCSGTALFLWNKHKTFWPHIQLPPVEGEKVVIVYCDEDSEILFLMRVLATGDECAEYVDDQDSINCSGNCAPYILTNVMGPVRIKKADWSFLSEVNLDHFSGDDYLPLRLTNGFRRIFERQLMRTLNRNNK